jgi:SAM-dependent methyltransferase
LALVAVRVWLVSDETNRFGNSGSDGAGPSVKYYKKTFWQEENLKYSPPHFRLEKAARIVNALAGDRQCTLLDVGCGPATLERLLASGIEYYGVDIAIANPAPNLKEADILEAPIGFDDRRFDFVVAQGLFEYLGEFQDQKFAEIAAILNPGGHFVLSYVNFDHRNRVIYYPYSNVQPLDEFRSSLRRVFDIRRQFPTSYNWNHSEPGRWLARTINLHLDLNLPLLGRKLGVEYFFICSLKS